MPRHILFLVILSVAAGCGVKRRSQQVESVRGEGEGSVGGGEGEGSACDCTDNIACTEDTCFGDTCVNTPVHARCGADKICIPDAGGCTAALVCMDDDACLSDDPCTIGSCELATRACTFKPLDGDADQHQPRVCGGDDCDDENPAIYLGAKELCNDADDNCDGEVDEGLAETIETCNEEDDNCDGQTDEDTNLANDRENCGECGNVCEDGFVCVGGNCGCPPNFGPCVNENGNEECTDLRTNQNCGECSNECLDGKDCIDGACVLNCEQGERICATDDPDSPQVCADTTSDSRHCGGCGRECRGVEECHQGICACRWPANICNGFCTNMSYDSENCGECGHACADNEACILNGCFACQEGAGGAVECNGRCTITRFDWYNCGACGRRCDFAQTCQEGRCL